VNREYASGAGFANGVGTARGGLGSGVGESVWPLDGVECHSQEGPDDCRCTQPDTAVPYSQLIARDVVMPPVNDIYFYFLFNSRDKSKASSQRDMCLKQIRNAKKFVPQVSSALRRCAVRKSPGAGEPPTNKLEK
jgi:hypothetical protein